MRKATTLGVLACAATLLAVSARTAATEGGVVKGIVRLDGAPPARPLLEVFKHREVCGEGVPDDRLIVGPGGGLRYGVVTVEGVRGGKKPEQEIAIPLDNHGCRFVPHVQVAELGQWLELHNTDPVLHNADARIHGETIFNAALPPDRHVRKPLARPGLVAITCDIHTWMSAFVSVADHPYHTVTDTYGAYEIGDLPAGTYTLRVWHEELGTQERPVTIEPGKTTTIDITFSPAERAKEEKPQ
jgi:hypothetical protein